MRTLTLASGCFVVSLCASLCLRSDWWPALALVPSVALAVVAYWMRRTITQLRAEIAGVDARKLAGDRETLRVWVNREGVASFARVVIYEEDRPGAWGLRLASVARQVGRMFAEERGVTEEEALATIQHWFDRELEAANESSETRH